MSEGEAVGGGNPYADEDKVHLFLAYFGIFSLIPFFMFRDKREDPLKEYVYWHARQGLALAVCVAALSIIMIVLGFLLAFIPVIGWILDCLIWLAIVVIAFGGAIMGWVKAFGGEKWPMPGVAKIAEMFN